MSDRRAAAVPSDHPPAPAGFGVRPVAAGLFAAPLLVGLVGSRLTLPSLDPWYRRLDRPSWSPPDRLFGPVWTTLYVLMGLAAVLVWRRRSRRSTDSALAAYGVQLGLNLAWSWLFFDRRRIDLALADILALDAAIAATAIGFGRVRADAAALLLPYLAWSVFATALNAELLRRNGRGS
jgi:translocator protein